MKFYILDISGRVVNYDIALFKALKLYSTDEVRLFLADPPKDDNNHVNGLLSIIPSQMKTSEGFCKRILKALEILLNYIFIICLVMIKRPDVLHFQWLPFLEVCSLERCMLFIVKLVSPKTQLYLTIHNIYPHGYNDVKRKKYKKRFKRISRFFSYFIAHTKETKRILSEDFNISKECIIVVHHGVFAPNLMGLERKRADDNVIRFISYGHQDPYKGTDLLLDATASLSDYYKKKIQLAILGKVQSNYYSMLLEKSAGLDVIWKNYFVDDQILYQDILDSDIVVLPYRTITQSGVLLLALYFDKPIICSDLPSFKETLVGYPDELFFKADSLASLKKVLENVIDGKINMMNAIKVNEYLRVKYSWEEAAKLTIEAYKKVNICC